ncbi:oxepin-CoA hydrolase, alternative type [Azospirillum picis]|uniref:Enoyl-CoA hydratase/carnithine racemase n=1 Tax=Azospirillum picis TaxID=488438 RepID=A0ABU0MHJ0_9PROT|nr:enoyl-CoA hydratase family protein [Azospirillum picis]MBP2299062.1 enoyl-CoA hydratase/carnithine racemase [Azospirillum picis]MDQ0532696.1 enoyl-CoA hydratase/carnithine racemase [Azospirillum picis]
MTGHMTVARQGRVMVLTMDDAATRNALGPDMMAAARDALVDAAADAGVGAVVLAGANGTFCSGGNLGRLLDNARADPGEIRANLESFHGWTRAMRACPKPVIAAVEGTAAGAGFSLALGCDLIVAAEDAAFTLAYVKVGLTPDGGGSAFLARAATPQLAAEIMFEGGRIGAKRLGQLAIVNRLVPPGTALAEATAWAARLAEGPTLAIGRAKRLIESGFGPADEQLDREAALFAEALHGVEAAEGIAAFFEKRVPDYPRE